jgi:hypothetical protein
MSFKFSSLQTEFGLEAGQKPLLMLPRGLYCFFLIISGFIYQLIESDQLLQGFMQGHTHGLQKVVYSQTTE